MRSGQDHNREASGTECGLSPEVWMRLQAAYDLKKAEKNHKVMKRVARIVPVKPIEEVRA